MRPNRILGLFVLICFVFFGFLNVNAEMKPDIISDAIDDNARLTADATESEIGVWGARESSIPWGQGPVNYTAGFTLNNLLPNSGWIQAGLSGHLDPANCAGGTYWGCGTGYKTFFQLYCDADNVLAFGIIWDPGVHQWIGGQALTIMVEGLANGQPVAGYWPLGTIDQGHYHDWYIEWGPDYISFMVDANENLRYVQPMTVNQVSLSFLNGARLPGDFCAGYAIFYDWDMGLGNTLPFSMFTWDTDRMDSTPDFMATMNIEHP